MASGIVTVGTASAQFSPVGWKGGRVFAQNISANDVWLAFGQPVALGSGLHLPANMVTLMEIPAECFMGSDILTINAIASAAGSKVFYVLGSS